jgi:DNA-binding CsgD family transcriptional regulator
VPRPEDLLAVLSRATQCDTLSLVEHESTPPRLRRLCWTVRGTTPNAPIGSSTFTEPDDPQVGVLRRIPLSTPTLLRVHPDGADLMIVVRRTDSQVIAWELTTLTRFDAADRTTLTTLLPLFNEPALFSDWTSLNEPVPALTQREIDILTLVGEGLTAKAIARRCGISARTVHKHLEQAYRKIGCNDRVSAVLFMRRSGLLAEDRSAQAS